MGTAICKSHLLSQGSAIYVAEVVVRRQQLIWTLKIGRFAAFYHLMNPMREYSLAVTTKPVRS